jgi:DNA-binding NarL/FixJ family response regulator
LEVVGGAQSGVEAVEIVGSTKPDVALIDVQLGEESGLEVARVVVERAPSMHVILISTHSRDDLDEILREGCAFDFLPKTALSAAAIVERVG